MAGMKPPELNQFYMLLHARGVDVEHLAARLQVSRPTLTRVLNGSRRRGRIWVRVRPMLTEEECRLLDVAHCSPWNMKRVEKRPRWTPEKAALLGLQVPDGVLGQWNGVDAGAADKLTANEWQRWAIYTAAHKACEDHAKYSDAGEPSMVTMLLGKQKRPPSLAKKATAEKRRKAAAKK